MHLPKTKIVLGIVGLVFLAWIFTQEGSDALALGVEHAFAQSPRDSIFSKLATGLSIFLVVVNTIAFLLYPILSVVVDPVFFLEIYTLNQGVLNTLWQVSRNIMNVLFVVILIGVALVTVVTANKDIIGRYAIKFVLAVILVNFSWFFPRVILDVGNVLTATIYKLPDLVRSECRYLDIDGTSRPCRFTYDFKFFRDADRLWRDRIALGPPPYMCPTSLTCFRVVPVGRLRNTSRGVLAGLIMNHGRLPDLARAQQLLGGNVPVAGNRTMGDEIRFVLMFIMTVFFTLALSVVLLLAMIALLVAFVIRIPVLWLTIAFMPFMFLGYVIGDLPVMQKFNTMEIFNHFVKAAFLPAVVAVPLTVGFIMLNVITSLPPPPNAGMLGQALGGVHPVFRNLWTLLWMITTILVIWKGFFMALSIDSIYEGATQGIRTFGSNLGGILKWLPMNVPFLPMGRDAKTKKMRLASLGTAAAGLGGLYGAARSGSLLDAALVKQLLKGGAGGGKGAFMGGRVLTAADLQNLTKAFRDGTSAAGAPARGNVERLLNSNLGDSNNRRLLAEEIRKVMPRSTADQREAFLRHLIANPKEAGMKINLAGLNKNMKEIVSELRNPRWNLPAK